MLAQYARGDEVALFILGHLYLRLRVKVYEQVLRAVVLEYHHAPALFRSRAALEKF